MKQYTLSIAKPNQGTLNEDSSFASDKIIAVSDGAGGGGLYADKWSSYLIENLPQKSIVSFGELDSWIDSIWESFYNKYEAIAKQSGGLLLDKFYDEGSFATLVSVWKESENTCKWISYGDSIAFNYNIVNDTLEHTFTALPDFDKPPYLINCKDPLNMEGFRNGIFKTDENSIVFCTSDALGFYLLLLYEISHCSEYHLELETLEKANTKNSQHLKIVLNERVTFREELFKLMKCKNRTNFERHVKKLLISGLISLDDYSLAFLPFKM